MRNKSLLTMLSAAALTAVAAAAVPVTTAVAAPTKAAGSQKYSNNAYIIQLTEMPVVAYDGRIKGYAATKPKKGQKIDPDSPQVTNYKSYLESRHDAVLASVGGGKKLYSYGYVFNGFSAELTAEQAARLASTNGVLTVTKDELQHRDTSSTPQFLGLDASDGLWNQLGGVGSAGEGIIIGIVDSGIWPESLSFSDRTGTNGNETKDGKLSYQQIPGWHGKCAPGEAFNASMCNQKLIGAQYFNAAWGGNAAVEAQRPWEFMSPRDYDGHGTHTAGTAGGNAGVSVTGPYSAFGTVTGMAPRARIAAYKALWSTEDASTASGFTSDLVAAIDQAVADGVDVINYSISGTSTDFLNPAEVAFLYAASAGVFVAASAGNSGPATSTVAHPSPWITTVAAGTHDRYYEAEVKLGDGTSYFGASINSAGAGPAPFVYAGDAGLPGADPTQVALCYSTVDTGGTPVLDPAKVAGKIVLCDRGTTARVNKSLAVFEAGGVGTVLANTSSSSLNGDVHSVPTVHVSHLDRSAVLAYIAGNPAATAQILPSYFKPIAAPYTASFSSRGPLRAGNGDLLKPDVIAPGQDILAAFSPMVGGLDFNQISGTSMSSPHVAGLAALLKNMHPDWTPMMIKSALMTSTSDVLDGPNSNPLVIFRQGAGHVAPNSAADPGLVYQAGWNDWLAFLCGTTTGVSASTCNALSSLGYSLDPSDLNVASIAIGDLPGTQTVTRRVTNVGDTEATYTAAVSGLLGLDVTISPSSLTLKPGQTKSFSVQIKRNGATLSSYAGGHLYWSDGMHNVRIPVVVRPIEFSAPTQVTGTGGPITYEVKFGYNGAFTATPRGLVPAAIDARTVADDPTDSSCSLASPNAQLIDVAVPAGTSYARFALFDADVNPGTDLDLCVYRGSVNVGSSGSGTSAEEVNLSNPVAATYTVVVQGWGVAGTSPFKLHTWLLGSIDAGNMTVTAPAAATIGPGTVSLGFSGLAAGTKYMGSVVYSGMTGGAQTIVRVDMP